MGYQSRASPRPLRGISHYVPHYPWRLAPVRRVGQSQKTLSVNSRVHANATTDTTADTIRGISR